MAREKLTAITGVDQAVAAALRGVGVTTLLDLVLAPRSTLRDALKAADIDSVPTMSEVATWQDRARQLRLEATPQRPSDEGWERTESFVLSIERRTEGEEETRRSVVERAEDDDATTYVGETLGDLTSWIATHVELPETRSASRAVAPVAEAMVTDTPTRPNGHVSGSVATTSPPRAVATGTRPPREPAMDVEWPSGSNPIRFWNAAALGANVVAHSSPNADAISKGPTLSARTLAIVHLAMHDAYFSIVGTYDTYLNDIPAAPAGASAYAAVDGAAVEALRSLHPTQGSAVSCLLRPPRGPGVATGRAHGAAIATRMLAECPEYRQAKPGEYLSSPGRGRHRADPVHPDQGYYGPYHGEATCFATSKRYRLPGPPFDDPEYAAAVQQVRAKGVAPELAGTLPQDADRRTTDETLLGLFWAYDGVADIGTPPRLYNQIIRKVSEDRHGTESVAEDARLFALVNVAMADAGILAWHEKYHHDFWRPVLGVREHDRSMGAEGVAVGGRPIGADSDPSWLPLGAPRTNSTPKGRPRTPECFTPNFPAYPSGHATFGAAAFQSARRFFKVTTDGPDHLCDGLTFTSEELNGRSVDERGYVRPRHERAFPGGLWQMIEENGASRLMLGVHWLFDAYAVDESGRMNAKVDTGGVWLGIQVANDLAAGLSISNGATAT